MAAKHRPLFAGEFAQHANGDYYHKLDRVNQDALNQYAKGFKPGEKTKGDYSRLTKGKIRSVEQNNYYWGVVIKMIGEETGCPTKADQEDLHKQLSAMFLVKRGKFGTYVESTTRLETDIFERYLQALRDWALEFHGIRIPLPNEVVKSDDYDYI